MKTVDGSASYCLSSLVNVQSNVSNVHCVIETSFKTNQLKLHCLHLEISVRTSDSSLFISANWKYCCYVKCFNSKPGN